MYLKLYRYVRIARPHQVYAYVPINETCLDDPGKEVYLEPDVSRPDYVLMGTKPNPCHSHSATRGAWHTQRSVLRAIDTDSVCLS